MTQPTIVCRALAILASSICQVSQRNTVDTQAPDLWQAGPVPEIAVPAVIRAATTAARFDDFVLAHSPYAMPIVGHHMPPFP